jgi:hypothetical protein
LSGPDLDALGERLGRSRYELVRLPDNDGSIRAVVLTLTLEAKVFGQEVQELARLIAHGLISKTNFIWVSSKDAEMSLLAVTPRGELLVKLQRVV